MEKTPFTVPAMDMNFQSNFHIKAVKMNLSNSFLEPLIKTLLNLTELKITVTCLVICIQSYVMYEFL